MGNRVIREYNVITVLAGNAPAQPVTLLVRGDRSANRIGGGVERDVDTGDFPASPTITLNETNGDFSFTFSTVGVSSNISIEIKATDLNNRTTIQRLTLLGDKIGPDVVVTNPPSNSSYISSVTVEGTIEDRDPLDGVIDEHLGWIIDTAEIDAAFEDVKAMLDHQVLNGIEGLENPTTEILSKWLWEFFRSRLNNGRICKITVIVGESPRSTAIYDGL